MLRRLARTEAGREAAAALLARYLAFALRTTRWTVEGAEHLARAAAAPPVLFAAWHERLALMPAVWLRLRQAAPGARMHILVSRSHDGRFIAAIVRRFAVQAAHGSSSRGGAAALRALLGVLSDGAHAGVTPDGPRGPRRAAQPGVAQLAALSGAAVLPCAAQTSRRIELRSWDRMVLPRPFGRGVIVCGPPLTVRRDGWREAVTEIEAALTRCTDRADALCRDPSIAASAPPPPRPPESR